MKKLLIIVSSFLIQSFIIETQAQGLSSTSNQYKNLFDEAYEITISVISGSGTPNFTFNTISQYTNGITNINAVQLIISSTRSFNVTVKAATPNFMDGFSGTISTSTLSVRPYGGGYFTGLSTTDNTIYSNIPSGYNITLGVDYNINIGLSGYSAGSYSGSVIYTATQL